MSKKFDFNFVPFTYEQLKEMNSDELQLNMIRFKRMIKEARRTGKETASFEVEFCYLDNERQVRSRFEKNNQRSRRREHF